MMVTGGFSWTTEIFNYDQQKPIGSFAGVEPLQAEDIARAVVYAIGQPPNVAVNEVLVRPAGQVR